MSMTTRPGFWAVLWLINSALLIIDSFDHSSLWIVFFNFLSELVALGGLLWTTRERRPLTTLSVTSTQGFFSGMEINVGDEKFTVVRVVDSGTLEIRKP